MKKILFVLISSLFFFGCTADTFMKSEVRNDSLPFLFNAAEFKDCNEVILNPDMGFYSVIKIPLTENGIIDKSKYIEQIKHSSNPLKGDYPKEDKDLWDLSYNLIHLEFDISAYSIAINGNADIEFLSENSLHDVQEILSSFRGTNKTAIARFAYDPDFAGNMNSEPDNFQIILNHVKQIATLYCDYADILTAIECGMIGPWGEMHSSKYAVTITEDGKLKPDYYIVKIMHEYLEGLKSVQIPFLVRQPKFIYAYLNTYQQVDYNFSLDSNNEAYPNAVPFYIPQPETDEYKIGLYNDGYLGSKDDSGTYKAGNRQGEIDFMSAFTNHTPYGGELIGNYGIENGKNVSVINFSNVHLSFLNIGWNRNFLYDFNSLEYAGESLFQYLYKHMGYRYLVTEAAFDCQAGISNVKVNLTFVNKGFANLPFHRSKKVWLFFIPTGENPSGNEESFKTSCESFKGQTSLNIQIDLSALKKGSYDVYLKLSESDGNYPLQLANTGWNDKLKATKIGSCTI